MYKFIQKNQKKFLAVFAAGLMIVFVLPQFGSNRHQGTALEVIGKIGGEPVQAGEVRVAKEHWQQIETYLRVYLGPVALSAREIEKDPEIFVLLQKEAQAMGLRSTREQAVEAVTVLARQYEMFGQKIPNPGMLVPAAEDLLLVRALFDRVAESIKLSDPIVTREIAANAQRVKLDLVHWSGADFEKDIPAPTPEKLQKQFDDFKSMTPGVTTDRNPFGFGYIVPSKVQLLYVTIPRDEISRVVRKSKEEFEWEVAALMQYRKNPSVYAATQATSQPTSQPATTQSATKPTTGPTIRPFTEVREEIITELTQPMIDRKVDEIAAAVGDRMNADYEAHHRKAAGAPADFGTRQYLERISTDIEKKHFVKLGISEINDPRDEKGLAELKGIGTSTWNETPFPRYAMQQAEPLLPPGAKSGDDVLSLDEPSRRLRDAAGNVYIFQLQDAQLAHPPTDMNGIKDKVAADVRTQLAFEAAVAAAKKFNEQVSVSGLSTAAKAAGKDLFTTPLIDRQGNTDGAPAVLIPRVDLPPAAQQKIVTQAYELLMKATTDKAHPASVVELPVAGRVVVAELADVEQPWQPDQEDLLKYQVGQRLVSQRAQRILAEYFRGDAVKKRLDYRPTHEAPTPVADAK